MERNESEKKTFLNVSGLNDAQVFWVKVDQS